MTLTGSSVFIGMEPPATHMACCRALAASISCMGPRPNSSAIWNLSVSCKPICTKYSGRDTSWAPSAAAWSISLSAVARFAAKSGADTICNAAIFMDSIAVGRITNRHSAADHYDLIRSNGDFKLNQFTTPELWKAQACHLKPPRLDGGYRSFGHNTICAHYRFVAVAD